MTLLILWYSYGRELAKAKVLPKREPAQKQNFEGMKGWKLDTVIQYGYSAPSHVSSTMCLLHFQLGQ